MLENETTNPVATNSETSDNVGSGIDYIEAINQLRNNTVPKEDYVKLREENKRLVNSLINGEGIEAPAQEAPDIVTLRKELFSEGTDLSNLDYMTKALQLRDAIIAQGGTDPFLPYGKKIMPTDEDIATANRVAEVVRECIEYADGDSAVFTNELMRRTVEAPNLSRARR